MTYILVALQTLGLYREKGKKTLSNPSTVESFARSLQRIASSSSTPYKMLPFTCVQSLVQSLPAAVDSLYANKSPMTAHIHSLVYSFDRMVAMLSVFRESSRPFVVPLVDCVCSRPVFLKLVYVDPESAESAAASAHISNPQRGWNTPPARFSRRALLHRWARLRVNVTTEQRRQAAISPLAYSGTNNNAEAYDMLVKSMLSLDIRKLDSNSLPASATYVVPFGSLLSATPSDMLHMQFESHPVWLSVLRETLALVRIDSSSRAHPKRNAVVAEGQLVSGRPRNPWALQFSADTIYIFMDDAERPLDRDMKTGLGYDSASKLSNLAKRINDTRNVSALSGSVTEVYRAAMHNAERVFQACMLVASGAHHDTDKDATISIKHSESTHMGLLAACACIGSAVAEAETGVPTRAFVLDGSSTEEHHTA
eukprot:5456619-Prymnesium_polylepis.1